MRDDTYTKYKNAVKEKRRLESDALEAANLFSTKASNDIAQRTRTFPLLSAEEAMGLLSKTTQKAKEADNAVTNLKKQQKTQKKGNAKEQKNTQKKGNAKAPQRQGHTTSASGNVPAPNDLIDFENPQWKEIYVYGIELMKKPEALLNKHDRQLRDNAMLISHHLEEWSKHPSYRPYLCMLSACNIKTGHRKSNKPDRFGTQSICLHHSFFVCF